MVREAATRAGSPCPPWRGGTPRSTGYTFSRTALTRNIVLKNCRFVVAHIFSNFKEVKLLLEHDYHRATVLHGLDGFGSGAFSCYGEMSSDDRIIAVWNLRKKV